MARKVPEWIAKHDDQPIPSRVKLRIVNRQEGKCAITGIEFSATIRPEFDHINPIIDGGEHRESNLQAIVDFAHVEKTSKEASDRASVRSKTKKYLQIDARPQKIKGAGFSKRRWKYSNARGCWIHQETGEPAPLHIQRRLNSD